MSLINWGHTGCHDDFDFSSVERLKKTKELEGILELRNTLEKLAQAHGDSFFIDYQEEIKLLLNKYVIRPYISKQNISNDITGIIISNYMLNGEDKLDSDNLQKDILQYIMTLIYKVQKNIR